MGSTISERVELAKLCSSRDWSKAIRLLDSLLSQSCVIQDICNRAFCYSQLELHKHVIKDCDKALLLDPMLLQPYILKVMAELALDKVTEAVLYLLSSYLLAPWFIVMVKKLFTTHRLIIATLSPRSRIVSFGKKGRRLSGLEARPWICCSAICRFEAIARAGRTTDISETHSKSSKAYEIRSKWSDNSEMCNQSSDTSVLCGISSEIRSISIDTSELCSKSSEMRCKSSDTSEIHSKLNDEAKRNQKNFATSFSKTKSINLDFRLSRGIAEVNEGKYAHAISIFDKILRENPTYPEALIGRGTAYAFQRELDAAIADFTKAIESNPSAGEAWKRRGQAKAALGESVEAIKDLTMALEFEPNSADILHERGIVNFKFKDFNGAVEDLNSCVKLDKDNKSAYTYLGLALSSIGQYSKAEEAHMESIKLDQNFLEAWAHLTQLYQDLGNPVKALECLQQILHIDGRFTKAYHLRGLLRHGMGEHRNAIKDLSIELDIESSNIESLYLRASCYHAIGEYGDAVKDYDAVLDLELDSMENFVLQCLAFYQKEIALYTASKINSEFCLFDIDGDIDSLFKEYWCKRLHPKDVCERVYRQPPLRVSLKKGKVRKQDFVVTKQKATLLQAADTIGKKIQYNCPGFLPNRRQHRMAGLAAIEIAQKVSKFWRSLSSKSTAKNGKKARRKERVHLSSQNRGGASCSTSSSSETSTSYGIFEDRSSDRSVMSWIDLYSFGVKWRQISEPCDPVMWTNSTFEEFNTGFGSHTPMILGQAKVVRYFPNYQRTVNFAKTVMKETMYVNNKADDIIDISRDGKYQNIIRAESCSDLYSVVGEDFWLATWCNSTAFEGKRLEGTRITLQKMGENGFDFAIRTPCTPTRWDDYDAEMRMAWEALCNAYCGEIYGCTDFDMLENVRGAILRMTYYWYNFMPLSRGSAAVGYVVLLGLFLAANMDVTGSIPQGLQVDWEAILTSDPNSFVDSIKSWLYPSVRITTSWKDYPDVASTLATTGSVVAALSTDNDDLFRSLKR
ncbi:hypothetical protein HHK36_030997 [Tetracentron sinense]|uniref:Suppressor of RPS4-RLD 1 n=1 Tax=Tetracentron sinense TaxID=13715 RepID=A0A834YC29_TETSI|nr:hypothetical protein HHK36_030997 [Tetracentron sinense]